MENTILAVGTIAFAALTLLVVKLGAENISSLVKKLREGGWMINTYERGILVHSTPLSRLHLIKACFATALFVPALAFLPVIAFSQLRKNIQNTYERALDPQRGQLAP